MLSRVTNKAESSYEKTAKYSHLFGNQQFWSCYCLRFKFLRPEKNWYSSETQLSQFCFWKNTLACTIYWSHFLQIFWLPNKMWIFRGLFIPKFNFRVADCVWDFTVYRLLIFWPFNHFGGWEAKKWVTT